MNWSGHGIMDLAAYDAYISGKLEDYVLPDEEIQRLIKDLEKFPRYCQVFSVNSLRAFILNGFHSF
jgi:hypothetical protein